MTIQQIIDQALSVPWGEDYKAKVRAALDADRERHLRERGLRLLAMPCSGTIH